MPARTSHPYSRRLAASVLRRSGAYLLLQRVLARWAGGFVLAFHNPAPDVFLRQIKALDGNRVIALDELVDRHRRGASNAGLFAITVDDGIADTVRATAMVAIRHDLPITYFLPTGYLDNPNGGMAFQWLNLLARTLPLARLTLASGSLDLRTRAGRATCFREMRQSMYASEGSMFRETVAELMEFMVANGMVKREHMNISPPIPWEEVAQLSQHCVISFQSHGVTHRALAVLSDAEIHAEISESRRAIEERTGRRCRHFCYPFGDRVTIGTRAPRLVQEHYDSAVTMLRNRLGRRSPHSLPRIPFYDRDDEDMVRLKVMTV